MKTDLVVVMAMALASMKRLSSEFSALYRTGRGYDDIPHKHHKHRRGKPKQER